MSLAILFPPHFCHPSRKNHNWSVFRTRESSGGKEAVPMCEPSFFVKLDDAPCVAAGISLFAWLISRTFSANEQYFSLTTNQQTILSAMAYQPSEQGISIDTKRINGVRNSEIERE